MIKPMKIIMIGESLDRQGGIVSVQELILRSSASKVQFEHIATLPNGTLVTKLLVFGKAINQLLWKLIQGNLDVVHIHVSEGGSAYRQMITAWLCQQFRKPVILHTHSCNFHEFYPTVPSLLKNWMSMIYGRCQRFIVLSESWGKFYIENLGINPDQVVVLPNPVKLPPYVPDRTGEPSIRFVFLGRIGQRKGAFDLIQAFAKLPSDQRRTASLVLAGDGEANQARTLVKDLGVEDSVEILNWIDATQRDSLLAQANIFVLPSYNEGLPMALIEAMSWGLSIITTPVGGIPELITHGENGLLVQPGDIQQLSDAMLSLIKNDDFRLTLGSVARRTVEPLDIHCYMPSLTNLYKTVTNS
jgi:glycosyltransferase involved in cell wall biosynthesis